MAASGSVFSETLQEITATKLEELSKKRSSFEKKKAEVLTSLESAPDSLTRVKLLNSGVKECMSIKTDKSGKVIRGHTVHKKLEIELKNLDSFLAQADYDPSLSETILKSGEASLMKHLDMQSLKYSYAGLYAELVTEWLSTTKKSDQGADEDANMTQSESFEKVDTAARLESRMNWERVVFEAAPVDEDALQDFLRKLFGGSDPNKKAVRKAVESLKEDIAAFELSLSAPKQFTTASLGWIIRGLLSSDLLQDDKRQVLKDFQASDVILNEVADLLNMRMAALDSWSWGPAVVMEQHRKISGIYNMKMHEDLLQAIFLYYIGVKWSIFLKGALKKFRRTDGAWASTVTDITKAEYQRMDYYAVNRSPRPSFQSMRRGIHRQKYFLAQLLDSETQATVSREGEEEADFSKNIEIPQPERRAKQTARASQPVQMAQVQMQQQPMMQQQQQQQQQAQAQAFGSFTNGGLFGNSAQSSSLFGGRHGDARQGVTNRSQQDHQMQLMLLEQQNKKRLTVARQQQDSWGQNLQDVDTDDDNDAQQPKRPMENKQRLLHLLSAEIAINTRLHGEVTAFHSVFESWNSLLPHATIIRILSFLGVSKTWMAFFTKFLQAPLVIKDDDSTPPRTRRRGIPASHALSDFFGEMVFFFLDYSVNRATSGGLLYRMYDDIWFWSPSHDTAVSAWKTVEEFSKITGTSINRTKTGAVRIPAFTDQFLELGDILPQGQIRWGFLCLSPETGRFEIDQHMVDEHITELSKQLQDKQKSVFSFIQAWNTYATTFFTSNFGKPANCFGRSHVDEMLATHKRIQREIFSLPAFAVDGAQPTSVVDYLKKTMTTRFGVTDIPDAYLFFPVELGGLDLQSPFISIVQVRDEILEDPSKLLDKFCEAEKEAYETARINFDRLGTTGKRGMFDHLRHKDGEPTDPLERNKFIAFDEFAKYREVLHYGFIDQLSDVYAKLLEVPREAHLDDDDDGGRIMNALSGLATQQGQLRGITSSWYHMEPYWKWVVSLYGPEVLDRFGGLNLVDPGLLPMGMVSLFREKRVMWQG